MGIGRTAEVYEWGHDKVVKLHYDWVSRDSIQNQVNVDHIVHDTGIPCPQVFEVVEVNGRIGIVYERIEGDSLLRLMTTKPATILENARRMAQVHYQIHSVNTVHPATQKPVMRRAIVGSESLLGKNVSVILDYLEKLPDAQSICHGDMHPDNVLIHGDKATVIDWVNTTVGHPLMDVAKSSIILVTPYMPESVSRSKALLQRFARRAVRREYLREYVRVSGATIEDIDAFVLPVAAARLRDNVEGEREWLLRMIQRRIPGKVGTQTV